MGLAGPGRERTMLAGGSDPALCRACSRPVSTNSTNCPHCGAISFNDGSSSPARVNDGAATARNVARVLLALIAIVLLVAALIWLFRTV